MAKIKTSAGFIGLGIFTENGSGGFMSEVVIDGGKYGLYGGNQQYTVNSFLITSQTTSCICLIWDWGWTWTNLILADAPVGITLLNPEAPGSQPPGSIYLLDTAFLNVNTAVKANAMKKDILETSIMTFDNINLQQVGKFIQFTDGSDVDYPSSELPFMVLGNQHTDSGYEYGSKLQRSPSLLGLESKASTNSYFYRSRPQYENLDTGSVVSVKDYGAKGDGVADDTAAVQSALSAGTTKNLIYFPAGSYIITKTLFVPPHFRITGEVWSQIVASGSFFTDMKNPRPMVKVGDPGDSGTVEISDMLFTSIGALPGLVMMEWNVQAKEQGSVGIWDAHFRVGEAYGSELQVAQCPKVASIPSVCVAAALMLHITPQSNGYFENVWAWVADHDLDDPANTMVTVAAARGILVESAAGPTWLYGTASEHSMLYQYNFYNTSNIFAGMIQTESPYFQYAAATESPGPFKDSVGLFNNDPDFSNDNCNGTDLSCRLSWAVMAQDTVNVTIAGAGLYSWFDAYDQSVCVDAQNCQQRLFNDQGNNGGFWLWNLITIGAQEMISNTLTNDSIYAKENTQAIAHPFWSALASYTDDATQRDISCDDDDTSPACMTETICDKTKSFATMDQLAAAKGTFADVCADYYAIKTLQSTLRSSLDTYKSVNKGYDEVFGKYQEYVKEMIPMALSQFMSTPNGLDGSPGPGNKYFQCTFEADDLVETQQCPFTEIQLASYDSYTMTYKLVNESGFFDELSKTYSISKDWVKFGRTSIKNHKVTCQHDLCTQPFDQELVNFPKAADNIQVANPKDIITKALPNIGKLQNAIAARRMDVALNTWLGPTNDIVQVISMPVFAIQQALDSMEQAKELGQAQAQRDKTQLILTILSIVFAFVPFLNELAPEIAALDGVFAMLGAAGTFALGIKSIVDDPLSAPMEILGFLTLGVGRSAKDFAKVADARRGIKDGDLAKMGKTFKKHDDSLQNVIKRKCKI
ncbi:hypothetical protein UVI_02050750 [Ustilaginoidea virens]|uniref:Rhamnogalacturonase A/B/Epimerase-like pectate lyase domain-containing protein n=1 Tax=Ustilaginoidea virens TaxID=1159556 RepID=A0A1B5L3C8_USTVR|nr:hypothetical protein UVI_02050750 [Ustilaginoidea virens]